jgi:heme a synthase
MILLNKKYNFYFHSWIITLILLLILMIIVGGYTRLTDSGLSITEWELFSGILPPLNENQWVKYFERYKEIPQFQILNSEMNLAQFKYIFFWEYIHRILGRFIGLFFLIPFIFFYIKKIFSREYNYKFLLIFFLILFQGFIGWYMVESGLVLNVSVSHYRLALHLFFAFIILSSLTWYFLNFISSKNKSFFNISKELLSLKIFIFLLYLQIILGAFVSGLDAGKIYQTWPLMNNNYIPDDINYYNFIDLNNHSVVQFLHRNVAYSILIISLYILYNLIKSNNVKLIKNYFLVFVILITQILLGIFTLLSNVHIPIAAIHQFTSVILIITTLRFYHNSLI